MLRSFNVLTLATATALLSGVLLGASFLLSYGLHLPSCVLCFYSRLAYGVILSLSLGILLIQRWKRVFYALLVLALCVAVALSVFHMGLERGWIHVKLGCTTLKELPSDPEGLGRILETQPTVPCDKISWSFLGLSLANYNLFIFAILLGVWLKGRPSRGGRRARY